MPVLRIVKKRRNYTEISNNILQNEDLTYEAKGMLAELLSRPQNWELVKSQLTRKHTRVTKVNRILKELQEAKHLWIVDVREDNNTVIEDREWFIFEEPKNEDEVLAYAKETLNLENLTLRRPRAINNIYDTNSNFITSKEENTNKKNTPTSSYPNKTNSSINKVYPENSTPYLISKHLLTRILENYPNYHSKQLSKDGGTEELLQDWSYQVDLMIRVDKRDTDKIIELVEWTQDDKFWRQNIKSTGKLREKYDDLVGRMRDNPKYWQIHDTNPELTNKIISQYSLYIRKESYKPSPEDLVYFRKTTKKMIEFYQERKCQDKEVWIRDLFDFLSDKYEYRGKAFRPSYLCDPNLWNHDMPQFLKNCGSV